jgi:hypothetical protein
MNGAITRNWSAMTPSRVQVASPILPPGRVTRPSSPATASWSGANITPKLDETTSTLASSYGMASASATSKRATLPRVATSVRAVSISAGAKAEIKPERDLGKGPL